MRRASMVVRGAAGTMGRTSMLARAGAATMRRTSMLVLAMALGISGCATTRPQPPSGAASGKPASPLPGTAVGTTASGGRIVSHAPTTPALVDSGPSAEAQAVLATIPDPLRPDERVPAPALRDSVTSPFQGIDHGAAPDSSAGNGVPVPSPTHPLGERPRPALRDSVTMPIQGIDHGAQHPAPATMPGRPDTCWRVQLAAPPEKAKAEALKAAAESQLLIPIAIEVEKGRYKVRTRDCLAAAAAADSLRRRAEASGFDGAFRFSVKRP